MGERAWTAWQEVPAAPEGAERVAVFPCPTQAAVAAVAADVVATVARAEQAETAAPF